MKNIVAAVDFSDCSINALEHAVSIAEKGNLNLYMIWVNNPSTTKTTIHSSSSNELIKEIEKQFKKLIDKYQPRLKTSKIDFIIREGKVYREVVDEARGLEAACIVIGTHGVSGFEQFWIGSNASKIISSAKCPVITLRAGIKPENELRKIVMPIDSTMETRQKAPFTAYLAKIFDAEVHVLAVQTSKYSTIQRRVSDYASQSKVFLESKKIKVVLETVKADNNTIASIEYAKKVNANLISIMTEQETSPYNLLTGPYAQQMINHSPFPVLCVNPIDTMKMSAM